MRRSLAVIQIFLILSLLVVSCSGLILPAAETGSDPPEHVSPAAMLETIAARQTIDAAAVIPPPAPSAAQDWVWVINRTDRSLLRIDPRSNTISGTLSLDGDPLAVAASGAEVWLLESGGGGGSKLLRIDPLRMEVLIALQLLQGEAISMAVDGDSVWVGIADFENAEVDTGVAATQRPASLARLDADTSAVTAHLPLLSLPVQLLAHDGALWSLQAMDVFTSIDRIDPTSLQITSLPAQIESMAYVYQFARMAVNSAGIWAISVDRTSRYVYRVDSADGKIVAIIPCGAAVDDTPVAIAADEEGVWVALRSGKVVQIDPHREQVVGFVSLKKGLADLFLAAGSVWAVNPHQAEIYRINSHSWRGAVTIQTGSKPKPTSTPTPRQRPGASICQPFYKTRLQIGGRAVVLPLPPVPNRLRAEPGLDGAIIGQIDPGGKMTILEGPLCLDGWLWWKVQVDAGGVMGWTAEGDEDGYWLQPSR